MRTKEGKEWRGYCRYGEYMTWQIRCRDDSLVTSPPHHLSEKGEVDLWMGEKGGMVSSDFKIENSCKQQFSGKTTEKTEEKISR